MPFFVFLLIAYEFLLLILSPEIHRVFGIIYKRWFVYKFLVNLFEIKRLLWKVLLKWARYTNVICSVREFWTVIQILGLLKYLNLFLFCFDFVKIFAKSFTESLCELQWFCSYSFISAFNWSFARDLLWKCYFGKKIVVFILVLFVNSKWIILFSKLINILQLDLWVILIKFFE